MKPIKPEKQMIIKDGAAYFFDFIHNKVALSVFQDWLKTTIPKGAFDITIGIEEDHYDAGIAWLAISWKIKIKNKSYNEQLKKYKIKLSKWNEQNAKC